MYCDQLSSLTQTVPEDKENRRGGLDGVMVAEVLMGAVANAMVAGLSVLHGLI